MAGYEDIKAYRKRNKEALVVAFGSKCYLCNLEAPSYIYDFHHIAPGEKEFTLSSASNANKTKLAEEAQKCVMLCANCHREVEHGLQEYSFTSNFNQQLFFDTVDTLAGRFTEAQKQKKQEDELKRKKIEEERKKAYYPSREELKNLIREIPFLEIGRRYHVSDNAIKKWCIKQNLPHRKKDINLFSDEEWEQI